MQSKVMFFTYHYTAIVPLSSVGEETMSGPQL